jgi:hypothetical protein
MGYWASLPGPQLPAPHRLPGILHEEVAVRLAAWSDAASEAPPRFVRQAVADALSETVLSGR